MLLRPMITITAIAPEKIRTLAISGSVPITLAIVLFMEVRIKSNAAQPAMVKDTPKTIVLIVAFHLLFFFLVILSFVLLKLFLNRWVC